MGANADKSAGKANDFAIVAVGASAGGLEAFTELLHALPSSTGMAFIFIQHLDPKHHSILSELLGKASSMPVIEAKNRMRVEPDHVYVIPSNANMGIFERYLQLTPRGETPGFHTPIDFFMNSLAEARNSRSVGVVLSGTASDGTRGLAAIKAQGGLTFAQNEKSAKYNGMPHSAIASGCVDFVLPPAKIGEELARISGHPDLRRERPHADGAEAKQPSLANKGRYSELRDEPFERIFAVLRRAGGINFAEYKPGTVQRRTLRRMAIHKIDNVRDYAKYLEKHPSETEALCQDLLIPVTSFFRDLEAFETLKSKVFPAIVKEKANKGKIRIWAPGCSTGEETYSLAIVLLEFLGDNSGGFQIQLFGTDVNERGIERARTGTYRETISQEMSPDRLRRFFSKVEEGYRVSKAVRDLCVFAKQNLAEDPPFSQMNLVACRNLLIYLGSAVQKKIMPILHYALRPSGFLMLGNSESVSAFPELFHPEDKKHKIFTKKPVASRLHYDFSTNRYPRETGIASISHENQVSTDTDQQQEADRIVLKNYAPPGVVINSNMEILQFRGRIAPYLEPLPGRASLHLLKIARRELVSELRTAVKQAMKKHGTVKRRSTDFSRNGQSQSVAISVDPLGVPETGQYLVLFEGMSPSISSQRKTGGKLRGASRTAKGEIGQIRRQLAASEEHLRSVIKAKEATDEEYQSANEEILSANEEMQSTNEELETSKEELQSANEELNTVNDELRSRNVEIDRANSDLNNLMASTTLPIVLVDRGLRIRRMTAVSANVLKILSSDIGRPISDIRSDINLPNLDELITRVIETLTLKDLEVQNKEGHWYSLQIRPYRTTDDKIDGAVLVLSDIDALKRWGERLKTSKELAEDIANTVREPLLVLNGDLKVLYINASFLETFRVNRWDAEGKLLYDLGNRQWHIPKLRSALESVAAKRSKLSDFEVEHDFPGLGHKIMLLNARRIESHGDEPIMLLAIEDITERKQTADALRQSHAEIQAYAEELEYRVKERTAELEARNAEVLTHSNRLQELSVRLMRTQDDERRRISRELHDSVGQFLAHAKMSVEALMKRETPEKEARDLSHVAETLEKCLTETRTISHLLHPPLLDEVGFASAAKWYTEGFASRSGIEAHVNIPTELNRLPEALELALFRILQESLTNVHRHSHSKSVDVHVELGSDTITLGVRDYGQGIAPRLLERLTSGADGGVGVQSMRERIKELAGQFEIESDHNGTLIRVTAPLPEVVKELQTAAGNSSAT